MQTAWRGVVFYACVSESQWTSKTLSTLRMFNNPHHDWEMLHCNPSLLKEFLLLDHFFCQQIVNTTVSENRECILGLYVDSIWQKDHCNDITSITEIESPNTQGLVCGLKYLTFNWPLLEWWQEWAQECFGSWSLLGLKQVLQETHKTH